MGIKRIRTLFFSILYLLDCHVLEIAKSKCFLLSSDFIRPSLFAKLLRAKLVYKISRFLITNKTIYNYR